MSSIKFNLPYTSTKSVENIRLLVEDPNMLNESRFLKKCVSWFEDNYPGYHVFMTSSCTSALSLAALALNIQPGDEVIMPSFNYVGVANAFANYGAKLVFVDINADSMNINTDAVEAAITDKTKAIVAMHYAAISCDMERIQSLCSKHNLILIEDSAQAIHASKDGKKLGSMGDFSCISFDRLKNISCMEGGVLLCKKQYLNAVDICYENGTNKRAFLNKEVSAYEWVGRGSKFEMSEYTAAVLYPLLEQSKSIIQERKRIWDKLYQTLEKVSQFALMLPSHMKKESHNGHIFFLKLKDSNQRDALSNHLKANGIQSYFHYIPLHSSIGNQSKSELDECPVTTQESNRLLRLPIHNAISDEDIHYLVEQLVAFKGK